MTHNLAIPAPALDALAAAIARRVEADLAIAAAVAEMNPEDVRRLAPAPRLTPHDIQHFRRLEMTMRVRPYDVTATEAADAIASLLFHVARLLPAVEAKKERA